MNNRVIKSVLLLLLIILTFVHHPLADEKTDLEVLNFVKEYLDHESKGSGIFSIKNNETGVFNWFEIVGILNKVEEKDDVYRCFADVDELGYNEQNYIIYFDISKDNGQYSVIDSNIALKHKRKIQRK